MFYLSVLLNKVGICVVKSENESCINWLSLVEKSVWYTKQDRGKKWEWLSARLAGKIAVKTWLKERNHFSPLPEEITIWNDRTGRPYIEWSFEKITPPQISLSHSKGLGMATVSDCLIGCDIEQINTFPVNTLPYFTTNDEIQTWSEYLLYKNDINIIHTLLWSIKEAVIKCLRGVKDLPDFLPYEIQVFPWEIKDCENIFSFIFLQYKGIGVWKDMFPYILVCCICT